MACLNKCPLPVLKKVPSTTENVCTRWKKILCKPWRDRINRAPYFIADSWTGPFVLFIKDVAFLTLGWFFVYNPPCQMPFPWIVYRYLQPGLSRPFSVFRSWVQFISILSSMTFSICNLWNMNGCESVDFFCSRLHMLMCMFACEICTQKWCEALRMSLVSVWLIEVLDGFPLKFQKLFCVNCPEDCLHVNVNRLPDLLR